MKRTEFHPILSAVILGLSVALLPAQTSSEKQDALNEPHVRVFESGWGPKGELVLAVRIYAGKKAFELGSMGTGDSAQAYSLEGSTLVDLQSGEKLKPLPVRPKTPYYGPVGTALQLSPNGWIQLGVAFPHPPNPGTNEEGKQNPYLLEFQPPDGLKSIRVEIPFNAEAEAAAQKENP